MHFAYLATETRNKYRIAGYNILTKFYTNVQNSCIEPTFLAPANQYYQPDSFGLAREFQPHLELAVQRDYYTVHFMYTRLWSRISFNSRTVWPILGFLRGLFTKITFEILNQSQPNWNSEFVLLMSLMSSLWTYVDIIARSQMLKERKFCYHANIRKPETIWTYIEPCIDLTIILNQFVMQVLIIIFFTGTHKSKNSTKLPSG